MARLPRVLLLAVAAAALLAPGCGCDGDTAAGDGGGDGAGPGGDGGIPAGCDTDDDGHAADTAACGGDDCDDADPTAFPGATEACDGAVDENCDGGVDEGCPCDAGESRSCYSLGDAHATRNVGACADGTQSCQGDGTWGDCQGGVTPGDETATCDGIDQDCDGTADEDLHNACGVCGDAPAEVCGNHLDDDCDGVIDPGDLCNVHCGGVDPQNPQPPELACCVTSTGDGRPPHPEPYTFGCVEAPGLAACSARPCVDLDGDPASACFSRCYDDDGDGTADRCVCGLNVGTPDPTPSAGCGFETPCARQDCDDRQGQPCYSGPPQTLGRGTCRSGRHDCVLDPATGRRDWTACVDEVLPGVEVCGDDVDNDCDGQVDESDADGRRCEGGGGGGCAAAAETCGNGQDDDCNGMADDGCTPSGESQACYTGPAATRGVGACHDGTQEALGEFWGTCEGEVHPVPETCADGVDSDCNGLGGPGLPDDPGCCPAGAMESCNGADDDCDGFVDEGTLNACGTCPGTPCYLEEFEDPSNCGDGTGRTCNGVEVDPGDPAAITLGQAQAQTPFIYIAVTGRNEVAKLDTVTAQKLWQRSSYGTWPSRTAVALDYSVWVGNRGFGCENDTSCSNLVHLDIDGNFVCKADIPGIVRSVAIDSEGTVWAGSYNNMVVYRVHGTRTLPGAGYPDGLARCDFIDLAPNDPNSVALPVGVNPYGMAISGNGKLWIASTPTVKIDVASGTVEATVSHIGYYGVAVDANDDVWFGGLTGGPIHRVSGTGPYVDQNQYQLLTGTSYGVVSAVTVAQNGMIWGSGYGDNQLWRVDPANPGAAQAIPIPGGYGSSPHGIAEDGAGLIWSPLRYGGYAFRYDPAAGAFTNGPAGTPGIDVAAGNELYTYSDMTGSQLRTITTREGHWIQNFDTGYPQPDYFQVSWNASLPAGTSVEAWVRSADTLAGLTGTPFVCGPYSSPPADLSGCNAIDGHRFAAVEMILRSTVDGARPSVRDITLSWARP